jgi:hypothetical protein
MGETPIEAEVGGKALTISSTQGQNGPMAIELPAIDGDKIMGRWASAAGPAARGGHAGQEPPRKRRPEPAKDQLPPRRRI